MAELKALDKTERGDSIRKIINDFGCTYSTTRGWLVRAKDGLDMLHDIRRPGPAPTRRSAAGRNLDESPGRTARARI